ncbi:tetratricopeptide repeat protein [Rheinheimera salexigens]|uniref:Uncharacterized protein n=1 Tax=Rheinheimera salexigens TaxID=1628148 RepID=A0A1E7Q840_9GAMM|nr:hypothetical protein [Rheinheimera salexigens]OEY70362.1 hypothetical protein BI198_12845 [Rheinheimera salexigens]
MLVPDAVSLPNEVLNNLDAMVDLDNITLTNQNLLSSSDIASLEEQISKVQNDSIKLALKAIVQINIDKNIAEAKKIFHRSILLDSTEPASWLHFANYLWARGYPSESYAILVESLNYIHDQVLISSLCSKAAHFRDLDTISYCFNLIDKHGNMSSYDPQKITNLMRFYTEALKTNERLGVDSKRISELAIGVFDLLGKNGFIVKSVQTNVNDPDCIPFFVTVDAKEGKRYFDLNMEIADYLIDQDATCEKVSFFVSEFN